MSNYEEDHGINDTNSNRDTQTASSNSANQSPYAARTAPTNYAEFAEMMQSSMHEDAGPGIMVDEDVWDQVFGGLSGRSSGASDEFIHNLKRISESDLRATGQDLYAESCAVCQLTYAEILTEEEYAEASDHYVAAGVGELGLRRLPCRRASSDQHTEDGHAICGKCAMKWLRMKNTCPVCRAKMDPGVPESTEESDAGGAQDDQLLRLFQALIGDTVRPANTGSSDHHGGEAREDFSGMYS